jgi:hypothetical protein
VHCQSVWPWRLIGAMRNPLAILLVGLATISFATGDARAGSVMALMVIAAGGTFEEPDRMSYVHFSHDDVRAALKNEYQKRMDKEQARK